MEQSQYSIKLVISMELMYFIGKLEIGKIERKKVRIVPGRPNSSP
jgi:hypothetical protein